MTRYARRGNRHSGAAGFTLLELLVGLAVFGLLVAGLQQGVRFGLSAWDAQERVTARRSDMDTVDRALRRLIEQAAPGGVGPLAPGLRGSASALQYLTAPPTAAGDAARAPNQVEASIGVDAAGRLVLRWRTWRHVKHFAPPPPDEEAVLLRGLARMEIAYWSSGAWRDSWTRSDLPDLVRLRLVFPEGDLRRWPDIVVAPRRERL